MELLHTIRELGDWRKQAQGESIGLVPTMGNLHAGHRALAAAAVRACDLGVASIFVNPLQFGPQEDLASYPRTLQDDLQALEAQGMAAVFVPGVAEMYPDGGHSLTTIHVERLGDILCGRQRPGHFAGVATVVAKLFNLVRPDSAFFGEKDYQQLVVIRRMVRDLCMSVEVIGVPTVREADGLALSSRNQYLSATERRIAPRMAAALQACGERLAQGERDFAALEQAGLQQLQQAGFAAEYFAIRSAALTLPDEHTRAVRVLAAGRLGRARLIDNLGLMLPA
ncbi:MAG TPA: pantoate--beta-alanine ligase [Salinisphaeraceae bacterium]|nr:pantoate--beta-alanine ligase [Salinisphaeraceae bacterium]